MRRIRCTLDLSRLGNHSESDSDSSTLITNSDADLELDLFTMSDSEHNPDPQHGHDNPEQQRRQPDSTLVNKTDLATVIDRSALNNYGKVSGLKQYCGGSTRSAN